MRTPNVLLNLLSSWSPLNETAIASAVGLWCVSGKKVDFADRRAISALEWVRYGQVPRPIAVR